ncbi:DUF4148 domain-containing protein [Paraburkholderia dipogonis]|uniref:DUF4148 domain-containing protein n=1 Tax=Paraburkholderia dipogonis TaxID=1211383 RepID=UPI0038B87CC9
MKHYATALAALILSTLATTAVANDSNSIATFTLLPQGTLAGQPQQMGKSREQVRQELIEAQRQGLIPNTEADYPPSQRSIDANKARHAAVQRYWAEND